MEKKLIASLARCNMSQGCGPSDAWLGGWAYSEKVRRSGLWNSDYVDDPYEMTASDVEKLEKYAKCSHKPKN